MVSPDELPTRRETTLAYGTACATSLVWIACVVPSAVLADASASSDLATPMARGPLLLLPALLLLVTGPIAVLLSARNAAGMRSLLACGDAFVTLFAAGILLHARHGDTSRLIAALGLLLLLGISIRDAIRAPRPLPLPAPAPVPPPAVPPDEVAPSDGRPAADSPPPAMPPSPPRDARPPRDGGSSLRLALAILALLMPASLLTTNAGERASYLAPFAYVAISALGSRLSRTLVGLRLTAAILLFGVSVHQVIAIRYATEEGLEGLPAVTGWTAAGIATFALGAFVALLTAAWTVSLLARLLRPSVVDAPA